MCGLVATVAFDGRPADAELLQRTSDAIRHRGPDDSGVATYGAVGLGFRRLAILDLSPSGHQPMESPDGQLAVVFNGEIYNYLELRQELQHLGRTFRSSGDTEVLLQAYDQWGPDCVSRFNGMWAFVIYDRRRQCIVASRDRFGVKPLYRWTDGTRLILASEIKAIVASGWYRPETDWETAARFLCHGHLDQETTTFFAGVSQLMPGSILEVSLAGRQAERQFWTMPRDGERPSDDPVQTYRALFFDAVRLRMRSDVPVGVCLSGGIDSSAIISAMASMRSGGDAAAPLQAFSYIPEEFSEADYINESIASTGAALNELRTSPRQIWDLLPTAMWHYDEPVHSPTALIGFELMRLAKRRGVTVVLNGQGADEVNAGYHAYFPPHWVDLLHRGRWRYAVGQVRDYAQAQNQEFGPLLRQTLSRWWRHELHRLPGTSLLPRTKGPSHAEARWLSADFVRKAPARESYRWELPLPDVLQNAVERRPLPLYLRVEDRNSMAHSVEARLPFLDYRLVSLAFSLPGDWKLRDGWNKYIVREALRGVIGERVRTRRDKMGFPTPSKTWWSDGWFEPMMELLRTRTLRDSGICDVSRVEADLRRHAAGDVNLSDDLFRLAEFTTWLGLDRNSVVTPSSILLESKAAVPTAAE